MPIQAYIDESGWRGQGPVFVMAGFVGRAVDWAEFSDRWKDTLAAKPSIVQFKMRDAAKRKGEFYGLSHDARNKKVLELVQVINGYDFTAISYVLSLGGFEEHIAPLERHPTQTMYEAAFFSIMRSTCLELLDQGAKGERFEIIFDDSSKFGQQARTLYPVFRMGITRRERAIAPVNPIFRSDDESMPLQAADLLAWLLRRSASGKPHTFDWIVSEFTRVRPSAYNQIVEPERTEWISKKSVELERKFRLDKRLLGRVRRILGEHDKNNR